MPEHGRELEQFDLQPHPRILPMLGEINLQQWQCLAELTDNAIDSFLHSLRQGPPVEKPQVHINLPNINNERTQITIRDNGPGMDATTLRNAVRAGWSGNDPISNLGMFGMGFNIATARLGRRTKVWTTRRGDREWVGLTIDFDELIRQRHYLTPRMSRPKADPNESGTEIIIDRLKPEQRQWLSRTPNHSKLRKQLGRVYSSMLRPNGMPISFELTINNRAVCGRHHCIWGGEGSPERIVDTSRFGQVSAYQPINVKLADRPFCQRCWQWLAADEEVCPLCESADQVAPRERRVRGWLGIQVHLHATEYGIDLLRHGRKIEIGNKELFHWHNGETWEEEYPIDDPRHRGRIVGEIHLDHCRVSYTKDRFDRNDAAWAEMVRIVRGDGPLRPDKARQLGFSENESPLYILYNVFRRSSPKPKDLAGGWARLLVVPDNDRAEEMAQHFYEGDPEYQTDEKWWELIEEKERQLLGGDADEQSAAEEELEDVTSDDGGTGEDSDEEESSEPPPRTPIPSLTREFSEETSRLRWEVRAYAIEEGDPEVQSPEVPWVLKRTTSGVSEFFVNLRHPIFRSATMTPLDALLAQLAWSATDFLRDSGSLETFPRVLAQLRDRYAGPMKLDPMALSGEANLTLTSIARSFAGRLDAEDNRPLFQDLAVGQREAILAKMATRGVPNPQQLIDEGRFLEYAPRKTLLEFFQEHPDFFLDGHYWETPYVDLDYGSRAATDEARAQVVRYYISLIQDAIWLEEQDPETLAETNRSRLLRSALALDLLAPAIEVE